MTQPGTRVSLLITSNDVLLSRVVANEFRQDLEDAGIGDGRYAFNVRLTGLSPFEPQLIAVRRENDGAHLMPPVLLEPASKFDAEFQDQCAAILANGSTVSEITERLSFLSRQAEALLLKQTERRSRRAERAALRQIKWRWTGNTTASPSPTQPLPLRALVVDEVIPSASRDAGSVAILSHMRSLQRLGFEVDFAAADMAPDTKGYLEAAGITCCQTPWHGSVEEVLRREADSIDLVYLHRASVATRYIGLVRFHQPRARLIYSVADLHFIRYTRQAKVEDRPELLAVARRYQANETLSAVSSDAVITHSTVEADILRKLVNGIRVHVVPWSVSRTPTAIPFAHRAGLAFVGHYGHQPNLDAALWLTNEIMPQVHALQPGITCFLAGSSMPDGVLRKTAGIEPVGQVGSLSEIFDRVRLTVAPMTYGAGIKGKVLESFAAGIPCVCTPIAAEGLDLPPQLLELVAADAGKLATLIIRLHNDEVFNEACRAAGVAYVADRLSESRIDALMRDAAGLSLEKSGLSETELSGFLKH